MTIINTDKRTVEDENTVTNNVTEDVSSSALSERKSCWSRPQNRGLVNGVPRHST